MALQIDGEAAHLVLCRTDANNALSPAMLEELHAALGEVERIPGLKLLVVRGAGRVFCIGADLTAVEALAPAEAEAFFRRGRAAVERLQGLGVITVAAVSGLALGAGFELALACDLRWVHAGAAFGFPEARIGMIPGWRGIQMLSRALSSSQAVELLVGGSYLGARAGHRLGLVSRVFEGRTFLDQVRTGVAELCTRKLGSLRGIKALLRARDDEAFAAAEAAAIPALWTERCRGW